MTSIRFGNPLAYPSNVITARHFGNASQTTISISSTTNVGTAQVIGSKTFKTTEQRSTVFVISNHTLEHTVANGVFDLKARVCTNADGTGTTYDDGVQNMILPVVGQFHDIHFDAIFDISTLGLPRGSHLLQMLLTNRTAGTLSWVEPNSDDAFAIVVWGTVRQ